MPRPITVWDIALGLEDVQRPLNSALGDAVRLHEPVLRRDRPPFLEVPAVDLVAEDGRELLVHGHRPVVINRHAP